MKDEDEYLDNIRQLHLSSLLFFQDGDIKNSDWINTQRLCYLWQQTKQWIMIMFPLSYNFVSF